MRFSRTLLGCFGVLQGRVLGFRVTIRVPEVVRV